jgi:RNA-binding protein YlmH
MNRDKLLGFARNPEDRLMLSRLADKLVQAQRASRVTWSTFLDPRQREMAEAALDAVLEEDDVSIRIDGGYEGAERVLVGFVPEVGWEVDDNPPIVLVQARTSGRGDGKPLTHRDWLGSLMGLGLKRETIGDILVMPEGADLLMLADVGRIVISQLAQVGAERVTLTQAEPDAIQVPERGTREIRATVMSLRLDAVAAAAFSVSRSRMADWIRAEKVSLNWEVQTSPAALVKPGSTLSLRGKGRAVLAEVGGVSRKGRTGIVLQRLT